MKTELTTQEMEIASRLVDNIHHTLIAKEFDICTKTVARLAKRPEICAYMNLVRKNLVPREVAPRELRPKDLAQEIKQELKAEMVKHEVLKEALPTPSQMMLIARMWELAQLHPSVTKGNIQGQQAALDSLWVKLGFAGAAPKIGEEVQVEKPDVYRAAWMDKQPN